MVVLLASGAITKVLICICKSMFNRSTIKLATPPKTNLFHSERASVVCNRPIIFAETSTLGCFNELISSFIAKNNSEAFVINLLSYRPSRRKPFNSIKLSALKL